MILTAVFRAALSLILFPTMWVLWVLIRIGWGAERADNAIQKIGEQIAFW